MMQRLGYEPASALPAVAGAFSRLVAPLSLAEIADLRRERRFRLQRRPAHDDVLASWRWDNWLVLIEAGAIPVGDIRAFFGRRIVPPRFYATGDTLNAERLKAMFRQEVSLIVSKVDAHAPELAAIVQDAGREGLTIESVQAIVTMGAGGALVKHYDIYDLVVLQVEGRKRWRLSGPPAAKLLPVEARGTPPPPTSPIADPCPRPW